MRAPGEDPEATLDPVQLGTFDLVVKTVGRSGLGRRDQLGPQPEVVSVASGVTERTIMAAGVEGTRAEDPCDGDMGQVQPGGAQAGWTCMRGGAGLATRRRTKPRVRGPGG